MVETINPVSLGENAPEFRVSTRSPDEKQENFDSIFDSTTLFADVFISGGRIVLIGPPPMNLSRRFAELNFYVNGKEIETLPVTRELDRVCETSISGHYQAGDVLEIRGELGQWKVVLEQNQNYLTSGMNVLITHQKDNDIEWILYWLYWHASLHKVDIAIIYDNGSTLYSPEELERYCSNVPGIARVIVVNWPIPFGATGGPKQIWDSDFGQHEFLHHARLRYLSDATGVLCCDIDELVQSFLPSDFYDALRVASSAVLSFPRIQVIQMLRDGFNEEDLRVHRNYGFVRSEKPLLAPKYGWTPSDLSDEAQLLVHRVANASVSSADSHSILGWHFGGIRKDWRTGSTTRIGNLPSFPAATELPASLVEQFEELENGWVELCRSSGFSPA